MSELLFLFDSPFVTAADWGRGRERGAARPAWDEVTNLSLNLVTHYLSPGIVETQK